MLALFKYVLLFSSVHANAMASQECRKRKRLNKSLVGYTSNCTLAKILKALRDAGATEHYAVRNRLADGVLDDVEALRCTVMMEKTDGGMLAWEAFMKAEWRFPAHFATKGAILWRVFDMEHRYPDDPEKDSRGRF